jgi:nitrate reductase molybdenum cofactor assembly chaperone
MTETYENLADLIDYPGADWNSKLAAITADALLNEFRSRIATLSLSEAKELYTRTFDLNPLCALEIGYHLFGENYKRGEFLANLRETEAPFDLGQETQLPDYLPVLLRLVARLKDEDLRSSLISECLLPALDKMLNSLKESDNPYRFLFAALRTTLQSEVPVVSADASRVRMRGYLPVLANAGTSIEIIRMPFDNNHSRDLF